MLAHDLRTPIAGIKLTASLLDGGNSQTLTDCSDKIVASCNTTLLMMDDLLSHIQMNSEGVQINFSEFILEEQINFICQDFKERMNQKGISLFIPSTKSKITLDKLKFRQILSNLVTNAVKFTKKNGSISISVATVGDEMQISVKDTGIGIPEKLQKEAFQIFTNARRDGTDGEKSTGIGLSITKRLVELLDGTIKMQSTEGIGTELLVCFPN
jgi:signal transduction histidine kinase